MDVKHLLAKNHLVEYYLNYLDRKFENDKNSKTEYFILFFYLGLIILTTVTLTIDDIETRLILFDITILFGSHRIYNTIALVIIEMFGLVIFQYYHLTTDKNIMFWTEIGNIYRQRYSRWTMPIKLLINDLLKMIKLAKYFTLLVVLVIIESGELLNFLKLIQLDLFNCKLHN